MEDKTDILMEAGNVRVTEGQGSLKSQEDTKRSFPGRFFAFLWKWKNISGKEKEPGGFSGEECGEDFTLQERLMLDNIIELHQARVEDVMIPRSDIEAVEAGTTLAEVLQLFEKSGRSRMPVYASTLDDPRGMIHIRDVLNYITRTAQGGRHGSKPDLSRVDLAKPVGELDVIRDVLFVPGSMLASQLLTRMQVTHTQIALVIDEHGGTDGLASMEDIVELVVGDIEDEHDDNDVMIIPEAENCWLVDASVDLEEVQEMVGPDFNPGAHAEDVDTIGGLVVSALDRIPARGEIVEVVPGYRFQVLDADRRRIRRIRMRRIPENEYGVRKVG